VAVHGRDDDRGAAVVRDIADAGGRAVFVRADLSDGPDAARALAAEATQKLGGQVDLLVNNAGAYPAAPTHELSDADLQLLLAVNVAAPHVLTGALTPAMIERGAGTIINLGSWISTVGMPSGALYGATKAAVEQLTRGWAAEYGPRGIRVNAIAPGVTATPGTAPMGDVLDQMTSRFPAGRQGSPGEIADAALFLAGPAAAYIHGAVLVVDGGALATRT
jgi:NAD(P)-dependent dehydrogenase (short-subunit alcohol dehydrogenase family)